MKLTMPTAKAAFSLTLALSSNWLVAVQSQNGPPQCDSCWCVLQDGDEFNGTCPTPPEGTMALLNATFAKNVQRVNWGNPFVLNCDPYTNTSCTEDVATTPAITAGGACVFDSPPEGAVCPRNYTYTTKTYEGTVDEAVAEGLTVLHAGNCGVCSSLHDYVVMGSPATGQGILACAQTIATSLDAGVECFQELGYTAPCAWMLGYRYRQIGTQCASLCFSFVTSGALPNGDGPACAFAECIACQQGVEDQTAAIAGRNSTNSDLYSGIVFNCTDFAFGVNVQDPCIGQTTEPPSSTPAPTPSPAAGPTAPSTPTTPSPAGGPTTPSPVSTPTTAGGPTPPSPPSGPTTPSPVSTPTAPSIPTVPAPTVSKAPTKAPAKAPTPSQATAFSSYPARVVSTLAGALIVGGVNFL